MKELQFTLYEVLGYLVPGIVASAGLYLIAVALVEPRLIAIASASTRVLLSMAVIAYIVGHCVQALANVVFARLKIVEGAVAAVPESVRSGLQVRYAKFLGKPLPDESLYDASDALVTQHGNTTLRDVYVYREGFYRGLTIALPLLAGGIACSWARWNWQVTVPSCVAFAAAFALTVGATFLTYQRFTRFVRYRVQNAVFGAVARFISQEKGTP